MSQKKHHAVMENFVFSLRGRIRSQGLTLSDRDLFATQSQKLGRTWADLRGRGQAAGQVSGDQVTETDQG